MIPPAAAYATRNTSTDSRRPRSVIGGHALRLDAGLMPHRLRYEQRRAEFLVQRLDAERDVHDVADDRVLLALGRPDVADDGRAGVQRDADLRRRTRRPRRRARRARA